MKRDPFKSPIRLAGQPPGGWQFLEQGMKRPIKGSSFWSVANKLYHYRLANNLPGATFEKSQFDLLCKYRRAKGLACDDADVDQQQKALGLAASRSARIAEFKARYHRKGGCRSCGKKRKVSS